MSTYDSIVKKIAGGSVTGGVAAKRTNSYAGIVSAIQRSANTEKVKEMQEAERLAGQDTTANQVQSYKVNKPVGDTETGTQNYTVDQKQAVSATKNTETKTVTKTEVKQSQYAYTKVLTEVNKVIGDTETGTQNYTVDQKQAAESAAEPYVNAFKQNYTDTLSAYEKQQDAIVASANAMTNDAAMVEFVNTKMAETEGYADADTNSFNALMDSYKPSETEVGTTYATSQYQWIVDVKNYATEEEKATILALNERDPELAERYAKAISESTGSVQAAKGKEASEKMEGIPGQQAITAFAAGVQGWGTGVTNAINAVLGNENTKAGGYLEQANAYNIQRIQDNAAEKGKTGNWNAGKIALDALTSIGNMVPGQVAGAVVTGLSGSPTAGKVTGALTLGTSAAGSAYAEAVASGASKGKAQLYGLLIGASEAGLEYVLGSIPGVSNSSATLSKLFPKTYGKVASAVSNAIQKVLDKPVAGTIAKFGLELATDAAGEALEEGLQEVLETHLNNALLGQEDELTLENVLYAAFLGAVTSFAENSVTGGQTVRKRISAEKADVQLKNALAKNDASEIGYIAKTEENIKTVSEMLGVPVKSETVLDVEGSEVTPELSPAAQKLQEAMQSPGKTFEDDANFTKCIADAVAENTASLTVSERSANKIFYGEASEGDYAIVNGSTVAKNKLAELLEAEYQNRLTEAKNDLSAKTENRGKTAAEIETMAEAVARKAVKEKTDGYKSHGLNLGLQFFAETDTGKKSKASSGVKWTKATFETAGKDGRISRTGLTAEYNGRTYYADKSGGTYTVYDGESGLAVTKKGDPAIKTLANLRDALPMLDTRARQTIYESDGSEKKFYTQAKERFAAQKQTETNAEAKAETKAEKTEVKPEAETEAKAETAKAEPKAEAAEQKSAPKTEETEAKTEAPKAETKAETEAEAKPEEKPAQKKAEAKPAKVQTASDGGDTKQSKHGRTVQKYSDDLTYEGNKKLEDAYNNHKLDYRTRKNSSDWAEAGNSVAADRATGGWKTVDDTVSRIERGLDGNGAAPGVADAAYLERAMFEAQQDRADPDAGEVFLHAAIAASRIGTVYGQIIQSLSLATYLNPDAKRIILERQIQKAAHDEKEMQSAKRERESEAKKARRERQAVEKEEALNDMREEDVESVAPEDAVERETEAAEKKKRSLEEKKRDSEVNEKEVEKLLSGSEDDGADTVREATKEAVAAGENAVETAKELVKEIRSARTLAKLKATLAKCAGALKALGVDVSEIVNLAAEVEAARGELKDTRALRRLYTSLENAYNKLSDAYENVGLYEKKTGINRTEIRKALNELKAEIRDYDMLISLGDTFMLDTGIDRKALPGVLEKLKEQAKDYKKAKALQDQLLEYWEKTGIFTDALTAFISDSERTLEQYKYYGKLKSQLMELRDKTGVDFTKVDSEIASAEALKADYGELKKLKRSLDRLKEQQGELTKEEYEKRRTELLDQIERLKAYRKLLKKADRTADTVRKQVERDLKAEMDKLRNKFELSEECKELLANAKTDAEFEVAREMAYHEIGERTDMNFADWMDTFRFFSMLCGTLSSARNFTGNVANVTFVRACQQLTALATVKAKNRYQAVLNPKSAADKTLLRYARESYDILTENELRSGSTVKSAGALLKEGQTTGNAYLDAIFGKGFRMGNNKATKTLRTISYTNLMDKGDLVFLKYVYTKTLAETMKARNLTPESEIAKLNAAKKYAIQVARDTCYHGAADTASALSAFEAKARRQMLKGETLPKRIAGGVTYTFIGGIMPFKNVPMQILRTGVVDDTVIGAIKGALVDTKSGDETAVLHITQGLSGTAIAALGAWLASMGRIHTGMEDDDEQELLLACGIQAYSVDILGYNIGLSWMGPTAMSLFMGASIYESFQDKLEFRDILNLIGNVISPMTDMSVISGLDDLVSSIESYGWQGLTTKPLAAWLQQFSPAILAAINKTFIDRKRRSLATTSSNGGMESNLKYLGNYWLSRIPGASYALEEYVDGWGRTTDTGNVIKRAWDNFFDIGSTDRIKVTSVDRELIRLCQYEEDGKTVTRDGMAPETDTVKTLTQTNTDGTTETVELTQEEMHDYKVTRGQTAYSGLEALFASEVYGAMSDDGKAAAVTQVYAYAKAVAGMSTVRQEPDAWVLKAQMGYGGLTLSEVAACRGVLDGSGASGKAETVKTLRQAGLGDVALKYYEYYENDDSNRYKQALKKNGLYDYTKYARE